MAVKIAVTPKYEDEKRQIHSNRLLLYLLLKKLTALSDIFFNFWKLCTWLLSDRTISYYRSGFSSWTCWPIDISCMNTIYCHCVQWMYSLRVHKALLILCSCNVNRWGINFVRKRYLSLKFKMPKGRFILMTHYIAIYPSLLPQNNLNFIIKNRVTPCVLEL